VVSPGPQSTRTGRSSHLVNLVQYAGNARFLGIQSLPTGQLAVLNAYGPRVAEPALGLVAGHQFSAPYEELRLKGR
jgi:hypothetical protein